VHIEDLFFRFNFFAALHVALVKGKKADYHGLARVIRKAKIACICKDDTWYFFLLSVLSNEFVRR